MAHQFTESDVREITRGLAASGVPHMISPVGLAEQAAIMESDVSEDVVARICAGRLPSLDRASLRLGCAGVYSSFLLHTRRAAARFGVAEGDIIIELGRRRVVGGQEDMIVDVALKLSGRSDKSDLPDQGYSDLSTVPVWFQVGDEDPPACHRVFSVRRSYITLLRNRPPGVAGDTMINDALTADKRTAVDKALSLLGAFGTDASRGIGVSELARRANLTKSTAFRLLAMLERNGVVERMGSDYRLGRRLHELGAQVYAPNQHAVRELLTPYLADLYELTHETVHLAILHGTDVVYLNKLYGHRLVRSPSRIGASVPAYCTGVGKALLAYDYNATNEAITRGLRALTDKTIVNPETLTAQLQEVRASGIAFDDEECVPGLACVAAPVFGPSGRPVAALSVAGATARFNPRAHSTALRRIAFEASRALSKRRASLPHPVPAS